MCTCKHLQHCNEIYLVIVMVLFFFLVLSSLCDLAFLLERNSLASHLEFCHGQFRPVSGASTCHVSRYSFWADLAFTE